MKAVQCTYIKCVQGVPKNALSECYWRLIFWLFLTKTKQDQAPPSHIHGKMILFY